MKRLIYSAAALIAALSAAAPMAASANVVQNVPATAAQAFNDDCTLDLSFSFYAAYSPAPDCTVEFPIVIPSGSTIDQIGIVYGDTNFYPSPSISASLRTLQTKAPYGSLTPFSKFSPVSAAQPPVSKVFPMMTKFLNQYPDAFVVDPNTIYRVDVTVTNGAVVYGLQITYN